MQSRPSIDALVKKFGACRLLVVGDLMLDHYVSGTVSRISPEAPVPVVQVSGEQSRPGGAANVAYNIRSLGGEAVMAGIVGGDAYGEELMAILSAKGIGTDGVVAARNGRTTVKMRVLADRQQVVRVDYENTDEPDAESLAVLCERVSAAVPHVDAVIIEDYGKGVICQSVVDAVIAAAGAEKLVGLDPKDNRELTIGKLSLATPNYAEACLSAGLPQKPLTGDPLANPILKQAGEALQARWHCGLLIITLGSHGMYMVKAGEPPQHIPTVAREVFDVSGAGDTVIATAMLALAAGADHATAAKLANAAAGVVVGKVGTATCSAEELLASWRDGAA